MAVVFDKSLDTQTEHIFLQWTCVRRKWEWEVTSSWAARAERGWGFGFLCSGPDPQCQPERTWPPSCPAPLHSYSSPAGNQNSRWLVQVQGQRESLQVRRFLLYLLHVAAQFRVGRLIDSVPVYWYFDLLIQLEDDEGIINVAVTQTHTNTHTHCPLVSVVLSRLQVDV